MGTDIDWYSERKDADGWKIDTANIWGEPRCYPLFERLGGYMYDYDGVITPIIKPEEAESIHAHAAPHDSLVYQASTMYPTRVEMEYYLDTPRYPIEWHQLGEDDQCVIRKSVDVWNPPDDVDLGFWWRDDGSGPTKDRMYFSDFRPHCVTIEELAETTPEVRELIILPGFWQWVDTKAAEYPDRYRILFAYC